MLADRLRQLMTELDSGRMSERDFDKLSRTVSNFSNSGAERQLLPEGNLFPSSSGTVLASTKLKLLQEAVKSSPSDFCWCMIVCQEVTQVLELIANHMSPEDSEVVLSKLVAAR